MWMTLALNLTIMLHLTKKGARWESTEWVGCHRKDAASDRRDSPCTAPGTCFCNLNLCSCPAYSICFCIRFAFAPCIYLAFIFHGVGRFMEVTL